MAKNYVEQMKQDLQDMEQFDKELSSKIDATIMTINDLPVNNLIKDTDNRTVRAHKNKSLRKINAILFRCVRDLKALSFDDVEETVEIEDAK